MASQSNHSGEARPGQERALKVADLFENSYDLIQIFTPEGQLLEVNPSWRETLECPEDTLPESVYSVIHPRQHDEFRKAVAEALNGESLRTVSITLITRSVREILVEGNLAPVPSGDGKVLIRGIFHEITKQKQYEELRDELIGTVSHELRTPLTVIREGASQIYDGLAGDIVPAQKEILTMILHGIDRLSRIINDLLDASRLESGKVQLRRAPCNMPEIVREVIRNFEGIAAAKGIDLQMETSVERVEVYLDRDKFIQILTNLISNAIKFTTKGWVKVSIRETEGFVECKVSDTGRGISGEDLPRVFEKFRQFQRLEGSGIKGTGLGLLICKKLVELHHGSITIDSYPLQGTTVTLLFPRYTSREVFREQINLALGRCVEEGGTLSLIVFDLVDFEALKSKLGELPFQDAILKMEAMINENLRRAADLAIKDTKAILVLLPDTKRENAYIVLGRLYQILEDYLSKTWGKSRIKIHSSIAVFPEDAKTVDEILEKIYEA